MTSMCVEVMKVSSWPLCGNVGRMVGRCMHHHMVSSGLSIIAFFCVSLSLRSSFTEAALLFVDLAVQDVSLPAGSSVSSVTAGTWLDPSDPLLAQLPAGAVVNRCSPSLIGALIYFCSFVLLCGLVLVNFVIGVIIDNFASSCEHDDLPVSKDNVDHFAKVPWCAGRAMRPLQ